MNPWGTPDQLRYSADLLADPDHQMNRAVLRLQLLGAAGRLERKDNTERKVGERYQKRLAAELARLAQVALVEEQSILARGFCVYTLWSADGERLYIGQSANVFARLGSHLGDARKRELVHAITVIRCSTRKVMDRTEYLLIREHRPPWNTRGISAQVAS